MCMRTVMPWLILKRVLLIIILDLAMSSRHVICSPDAPNYMSHSCLKKITYGSGDIFQANLNYTLFTEFPAKASVVGGFSNFTKGSGVDRVYALYYCSGDVDARSCHDCVQAAAGKITDACKFMKEAIVWFEECTLRYANHSIFSYDEETPNYLYYNNTNNVSELNLGPYEQIFDSTMDVLVLKAAYSNGATPGFATKETILPSSQTLRGLAQCTPDIVGRACETCLRAALRQRDTWANTMIFLPSCSFRYDLYGSVEPSDDSPSPGSLSVGYIVLIVILSALFVVIGGIWLWKRLPERDSVNNEPYSEEQPDDLIDEEGRRVQGLPNFTFQQLEQMTDGFKERLGEGAYAVVYYGLLNGSKKVAVKMLNEKDGPKQFSNEINVMGRICHSNLVSLLGYCEDKTKLALVYEYMSQGDLKAFLSDNAASLSWKKRLEIAIDTAEGLRYLHDHCKPLIVHRDVKPANILLNEQLQAKVADFGFSKIFPKEDVTTLETRVIGTHGYTAPEYHHTALLNEKADVYSFGVVLLELITGIPPRRGFDLIGWIQKIFDTGDIETILDHRVTRDVNYSSVWKATELVKSCIALERVARPTMWQAVIELKQCLDMEMKNDTGSSSTGYTSKETMTAGISETMEMGPEAR